MKTIRVFIWATILAFALPLRAQDVAQPLVRPTQGFMRQKLTYSQGILEGLVTENYNMVFTNAVRLRGMNLTNAFLALGNRNYLTNIADFQAKVDKLAQAAVDKNLKGATEAYPQMVESCFNCHKEFRAAQFRDKNYIPK